MPRRAKLFKSFRAAGTNGRLDLGLFLGEHLQIHLKDHTKYDKGLEIHGKTRRVLFLVVEAQLAGCLSKNMGKLSFRVGQRHPVTMRKASFKTLSMKQA